MLDLERLNINEYALFIEKKIKFAGKKIEFELIKQIITDLNIHTFYVQYIFNKLYDNCIDDIKKKHTDLIISNILKEKECVFLNYRNILITLKFELLKAIGKEQKVEKPNASDFVKKYNFAQASFVN